MPELRLVIDIDGAYHARRGSADARRERELRRAGYRVVRVWVSPTGVYAIGALPH